MTLFWIVCVALGLSVAALLVRAMLRGERATGPAEAFDLQVYRDQLKEIDRDLARGVIAEAEAERMRTEVSRRILNADAKAQGIRPGQAERGPTRVAAGLMALVVLGGGFVTYWQIGAPGYPDLPLRDRIAMAEDIRDNRPSQAEAEAQVPPSAPAEVGEDYAALVTQLRGAVAERPDDLRGQRLLARSEAALGNFAAAYAAQKSIIALRGDQASARDYADLADMLVLAAGGYVSPEAQAALEEALARDPANGVARYYGGLMMAQTGRPDVAFRMWDTLLRESPPDAPWQVPIRAQIEEMAFRAGVTNYSLPQAPRGPSQADIDAASELSADDRMQMIRGMVGGLSDRLATEGGPPEDWARLINALAVLGEDVQARAIWTEAQAVFADTPDALTLINDAAKNTGIVE